VGELDVLHPAGRIPHGTGILGTPVKGFKGKVEDRDADLAD
jgi:hypothetical protein